MSEFHVDFDFEFNAPQWADLSQEQDPFADAWLDTAESYFSADCRPKKRRAKRATLPNSTTNTTQLSSENIPMNSLRSIKHSLAVPVKAPAPVLPEEKVPPKMEEVVVKKPVTTRVTTPEYRAFMNFRTMGFW